MTAPLSPTETSPLLPTRVPNDIRPDRNEGLFLETVKQAKTDQTPSPGQGDTKAQDKPPKTEDPKTPPRFTLDFDITGRPPARKDGSSADKRGPAVPNGGSTAPNGGSTELKTTLHFLATQNIGLTGTGEFSSTGGKHEFDVKGEVQLLKNAKENAKFGVEANGKKVTGYGEYNINKHVTVGGKVGTDGSYEGHVKIK